MHRALIASGLVIAALCTGALWAQPQNEEVVSVELSSFKFTPSLLTFHRGASYRLHLVNRSSGGHDFVAKEFFASTAVAPEDRGKIADGKINVAGGESVDIRLVPNAAGSYALRCTHFMHSTFGMKGTIVVQ